MDALAAESVILTQAHARAMMDAMEQTVLRYSALQTATG